MMPSPDLQPNAPPQQAAAPYRAQGPAPGFAPIGAATRWVFAAVVSVMSLGLVVAIGGFTAAVVTAQDRPGHEPDPTLMAVAFIAFGATVLLLYAQVAAALVWVHKAWSWLPWDQRYTRHWKGWISPSQASLMLLIPYFHYYWMFVANCGLCDALDRLRVSYPTREPAPKTLAIIACICQLVVPIPVGGILWLVFMSKIERMTQEMSAAQVAQR